MYFWGRRILVLPLWLIASSVGFFSGAIAHGFMTGFNVGKDLWAYVGKDLWAYEED